MKKQGLYRSKNGKICGVCGGIAEFFDISPFWTRTGTLILFFVTGFFPTIIAYLLAAVIMKPSPAYPIHDDEEREFYDAYVRSPKYTIHSIKQQFDNLERRVRRMEDVVTGRTYDWDRKFNE